MLYQGLVWDEKLGQVLPIGRIFFHTENHTDVIKKFSKPLMSISNRHSYKTFSESLPASLLHCIKNILSDLSGKHCDSLTMAALHFTSGCSEFYLYCIYSLISPRQQCDYQLEKKMIPIPLLVFHLVQAFGTVKSVFNLITY